MLAPRNTGPQGNQWQSQQRPRNCVRYPNPSIYANPLIPGSFRFYEFYATASTLRGEVGEPRSNPPTLEGPENFLPASFSGLLFPRTLPRQPPSPRCISNFS